MTFTEAAAEVLRIAGKPLHFKDITQLAIEKNLLSHVGKTPDVTMGARLSLAIKKEPDGPLVRVKPGVFALRDWEQGGKKKKKAHAEKDSSESAEATSTAESDAATEADDAAADGIAALASEVDAAENAQRISEPAPSSEIARRDDEEVVPLDEDEKMRGQLAAGATDLFEEEDDDDQPLFGGPEAAPGAAAAGEGGRRRRRRRRRGKGREGEQLGLGVPASGSPPSSFVPAVGRANIDDEEEETIGVTIGDERDEQPTRRAIVLERVPPQQHGRGGQRPQEFRPPNFHRGGGSGGGGGGGGGGDRPNQQSPQGNFDLSGAPAFEGVEAIDDLAGRELADVVLAVLNAADRAQGPIPCRSIADAALRRGKLTGDPALAASSISAACRADNLKRAAAGQRPRFRFAGGGRVAPTDWVLGPDLVRLEQEALSAIERYRDASRRALASKLQKDMSGAALIELLLTVLERLGFRDIKPVRRAGLPGGESHFSGVHVTNGGDEIRTAIVLRRDGREIGRERVIDLRGSMHHYAEATAGWLITTGQCLSGAREEATAPGTTPITLFDGIGFAKLLEEGDVAVIKTRITLPFPDLELLETLRGI
jgi:hypothetical protein